MIQLITCRHTLEQLAKHLASFFAEHANVQPACYTAAFPSIAGQIDACSVKGQHPPPEAAYALVLVAVALVALGDGICQGTLYGDAALLPGKYTQVRAVAST